MQPDDSLIIQTSQHRAGLRVEVSGPGTYANTLAYWTTIAKAVREQFDRLFGTEKADVQITPASAEITAPRE